MMAMDRHHSRVPAPLLVSGQSERIVDLRWWRSVAAKVVLGFLLVVAMDLVEVARFEAGDKIVEELEHIDRRLVG